MKIKDIILSKTFIILFILLICFDFVYPVTFTFDSGHYLSYLNILSGKAPWSTWDPVRGFVFPYFLKFSLELLGQNQNALLIPLTIFHILLFILSSYLIIEETNANSGNSRTYILIAVFLLIGVDPLIFGFYHTLLTEFLASSIAVTSCVAGYLLIKTIRFPLNLSKPTLLLSGYFILAVPIAWHLKQPYVGAAWFPLLITSLLLILRLPRKSIIRYIVALNILVLLFLFLSIFLWNRYLPKTGQASNPERKISTYIGEMLQKNITLLSQSPVKLVINIGKDYLALSNIFTYDTNYVISKKISFIRAHENNAIGYRMYQMVGENNYFIMPEIYLSLVRPFFASYNPPHYFNFIENHRLLITNFQFSFLYAILPFLVIVLLIYKVKYYKDSMYLDISILCTGSALLNISEHSIIYLPIDRYIFWGYPLLLIFVIIFIINLVRKLNYLKIRVLPSIKQIDIFHKNP